MNIASVKEIKAALEQLSEKEINALCLQLIKFKKDNKELVNYVLFEAHDEDGFVEKAKESIEEAFAQLNHSSSFLAKKTLRKMMRIAAKYARYSAEDSTAAALYIFVGEKIAGLDKKLYQSRQISNLFFQALKKAETAVQALHEDLQFDFRNDLTALREFGLQIQS